MSNSNAIEVLSSLVGVWSFFDITINLVILLFLSWIDLLIIGILANSAALSGPIATVLLLSEINSFTAVAVLAVGIKLAFGRKSSIKFLHCWKASNLDFYLLNND